jgi:hypothetical protein
VFEKGLQGEGRAVPTRDQVKALLDEGHSYETAGRVLGVPAGLAHLIATGQPAELSNPPSYTPSRKEHVLEWVRRRAARDLRVGR